MYGCMVWYGYVWEDVRVYYGMYSVCICVMHGMYDVGRSEGCGTICMVYTVICTVCVFVCVVYMVFV